MLIVMESDVRKSFYSDPKSQFNFLEKIYDHFDKETITLKELNSFCDDKKNGVEQFPYFILRERKVARNTFNIVPKNAVARETSVSAE